MTNQELTEKVIRKDSKFDDVCKGDLIEIIGISDEDQDDKGLVLQRGSGDRLDLVMVRNGPMIEFHDYKITSQGVERGVCRLIYGFGSSAYDLYDKKLRE